MLDTFRDDSSVSRKKYFKQREERGSLTISPFQNVQHKRTGVAKSGGEMSDDRKHEKIKLVMLGFRNDGGYH